MLETRFASQLRERRLHFPILALVSQPPSGYAFDTFSMASITVGASRLRHEKLFTLTSAQVRTGSVLRPATATVHGTVSKLRFHSRLSRPTTRRTGSALCVQLCSCCCSG